MVDFPFMSLSNSYSHLSLKDSDHGRQSDVSELIEQHERGRQILIMNVDIGDGRSDEIVVHELDEPEDLAKAFCEKYGLSPQICQALSLQIESNIEQLVEEQCTFIDESPKKSRPSYESPMKAPTSGFYKQALDEFKAYKTGLLKESFTDHSMSSFTPKKRLFTESGELPGHRLYRRGMIMKKAQQEMANKRQKEKEDQEVAELTFSPRIIKRTSTEGKLSEASSPSISDRLKTKEGKIKLLKEELEYKELVDCTFKPSLSTVTRKLMQNRSTSRLSERFEKLYNEAKELNEKRKFAEMDLLRSICPFKPEIIESPVKSQTSVMTHRSSNVTPIRLRTPVEQLKSVDAECSFKPKTGRPPKFNRNTDELPIGAYLHALKLKRGPPTPEPNSSARQSVYAGENSVKIVDKLRFERYAQIFSCFCQEGSSFAVFTRAQLEKLDPKLAKILTPLIDELSSTDKQYDLQMFSEALDNFARKLSPIDKGVICSTAKAPPAPDKPTFKPKITEYVTPKLQERSKSSLYDRLAQDKQKYRIELNKRKIKKIEDELYECTFYPNTLELRKSIKGDAEPEAKTTTDI